MVTTLPEPGSAESTRVIAVVNQKGGVGKSTTAVNLGAALAEMGKKVLVVDLDPQGNASTGLGIDHGRRDITSYQVLTAEVGPREAISDTPVPGLWAIPSTIDLAGAEIELVSQFSRETRLRRSIEELAGSFDFIFLDCPPSLGLLTINALTAAGELLVPIQCEYYALEGLGQLLRNVRLVQQNLNSRLRLSGIVLTMFDRRTRLSEQVVAEVRRYFGARVYDTVIPRTVRLSEAPGYGLPITHYDARSRGAAAYRTLAREVMERPVSGEPLPTGEPPRVVVREPPSEPEEDEADLAPGEGEPEPVEGPPEVVAQPEGEGGHASAGRPPEVRGGPAETGGAGLPDDPKDAPPAGGPIDPAISEPAGPDPGKHGRPEAGLVPPKELPERREGGAQEPEREGLGGPAESGGRGAGEDEAKGDGARGRWRLFRRKQGGEW